MARGGAEQRSPYPTVVALGAWALRRSGYVRGRLRLAGIDPRTLSLAAALDLIEGLLVEHLTRSFVNAEKFMDELEESLRHAVQLPVARAKWGTDPEAVAAQRAMMALAGGPLPPRRPEG